MGKFSSARPQRNSAGEGQREGQGPQLDSLVEKQKWYLNSVLTETVAPPVVSQDAVKKAQRQSSNAKPVNPVTAEQLKAQGIAYLDTLATIASKDRLARADQKWVEDMLNTGMSLIINQSKKNQNW